MAADWKLVGGGCKTREMFCTFCTYQSSLDHQPNDELYERFCADNIDDINWKCYHHPTQYIGAVGALTEEMDNLRASLVADLDQQ